MLSQLAVVKDSDSTDDRLLNFDEGASCNFNLALNFFNAFPTFFSFLVRFIVEGRVKRLLKL